MSALSEEERKQQAVSAVCDWMIAEGRNGCTIRNYLEEVRPASSLKLPSPTTIFHIFDDGFAGLIQASQEERRRRDEALNGPVLTPGHRSRQSELAEGDESSAAPPS